jgi:hypothetical protein
MGERFTWSPNKDDEFWRGGPCDSIKECVEEALDDGYELDETIALGLIEPYEINYDFADDIVYRLSEDAFDEVGEASDGWLDSAKREQLDLLNERITPIVEEWLKEIHEEPMFYKIHPCKECTLMEALELHEAKIANMRRGGKIEN